MLMDAVLMRDSLNTVRNVGEDFEMSTVLFFADRQHFLIASDDAVASN